MSSAPQFVTEADILAELSKGPVTRWPGGALYEREQTLQALRKAGRIRYVKVRDGGKGWELVKP